jgi:hypothetical protein
MCLCQRTIVAFVQSSMNGANAAATIEEHLLALSFVHQNDVLSKCRTKKIPTLHITSDINKVTSIVSTYLRPRPSPTMALHASGQPVDPPSPSPRDLPLTRFIQKSYSIFLKLRIWSDLSLMATITLDLRLRLRLHLWLTMALTEGFSSQTPH